ncbi:MAG: PilZ domain-containing protein [Archangium sp.]|nr:PilZ domain-containing protein [Archangium sp.]
MARELEEGSRMYPQDNRNNRRVLCQARFLGATSSVLRGDIIDVSPTGLCLALDAALERGRELHLDFDLPTGRVEAVGEVRWVVEKNGRVELGIRFVRISSEAQAVIAAHTAPKVHPVSASWFSQFALR